MSAISLYLAGLKKSLIGKVWPFLTPIGWFLGLGLFQNMLKNLILMKPSRQCGLGFGLRVRQYHVEFEVSM